MRLKYLVLILNFLLSTAISQSNAQSDHWAHKSHKYISTGVDDLAQWIDNFFHSENYDSEAAEGFMRLRVGEFLHEGRSNKTKVDLRGNLRLPAMNERLSLIIEDNENDEINQVEQTSQQDTANTNVALQYRKFDKNNQRLDFRLGIRSSGALKSAIRYRYRHQFDETKRFQFTNRLRFRGDEGLENIMNINIDIALSDDKVFQQQNRINYGEITQGVEWFSYIGITKRLSEDNAFSYFTEAQGHTQPIPIMTEVGIGTNYRKRLVKDTLYLEFRPSYYWEKRDQHDYLDGHWRALIRLEAIFD